MGAILAWPCWQLDGQFNYGLFRSFSSMFHHKKLPGEEQVKAILAWPCWQVGGQFNYKLFRSFSCMFHGKGLPNEAYVAACLSWLSGADDLDGCTLESISALFASVFAKHKTSGIPDIERLTVYEQQLMRLLPLELREDDDCRLQLKQVTFCLLYTSDAADE